MRLWLTLVMVLIFSGCVSTGRSPANYIDTVAKVVERHGAVQKTVEISGRPVLFSNIGIMFLPKHLAVAIADIYGYVASKGSLPEAWPPVRGEGYQATYRRFGQFGSFDIIWRKTGRAEHVYFRGEYMVSVNPRWADLVGKIVKIWNTPGKRSFDVFP